MNEARSFCPLEPSCGIPFMLYHSWRKNRVAWPYSRNETSAVAVQSGELDQGGVAREGRIGDQGIDIHQIVFLRPATESPCIGSSVIAWRRIPCRVGAVESEVLTRIRNRLERDQAQIARIGEPRDSLVYDGFVRSPSFPIQVRFVTRLRNDSVSPRLRTPTSSPRLRTPTSSPSTRHSVVHEILAAPAPSGDVRGTHTVKLGHLVWGEHAIDESNTGNRTGEPIGLLRIVHAVPKTERTGRPRHTLLALEGMRAAKAGP
jgi:hypothetical protein